MKGSPDDFRRSERGDESSPRPSKREETPPPERDDVPALVRELKASDTHVRATAAESLRHFARAESLRFQPTDADRELESLGLKMAAVVFVVVSVAIAIVRVIVALAR